MNGQEVRLREESAAAFQAAAESPNESARAAQIAVAVEKAGDAELAAAYSFLQKLVGLIAVLLPVTLAVGNFFFEDDLRGSISAYYYTRLGTVFVGSLWALGVFFLSYHYKPVSPSFVVDRVLSTVAAVLAVCVAVFPTSERIRVADTGEKIVSAIHIGSASVLFVLLGVFAFFLFTKSDDPNSMTPWKQKRNRVYRICGVLIFGSIALAGVTNVPQIDFPSWWPSLFWFETVCVEAFGISWLVKGGFLGILADPEETPTPAAPPA